MDIVDPSWTDHAGLVIESWESATTIYPFGMVCVYQIFNESELKLIQIMGYISTHGYQRKHDSRNLRPNRESC